MSQVSGALSLDMGKVAEASARHTAEILLPILNHLSERVDVISEVASGGYPLMNPQDAAPVLAHYLPEIDEASGSRVLARVQGERLYKAGYVLVAVRGEALDYVLSEAPKDPGADCEPATDPVPVPGWLDRLED